MVSPLISVHAAGVQECIPAAVAANTGEMSAATGANSDAVVSLPADAVQPNNPDGSNYGEGAHGHVVSQVWWSYVGSTTPTGRILLQDGSGTLLDIDVTASGPGSITFTPAKLLTTGSAATLTAKAGGAGVTGKVGITCWRQK